MPREETGRVPGEAGGGTHGFQQLCSVRSSTRSLKQLFLESSIGCRQQPQGEEGGGEKSRAASEQRRVFRN